MKKRKFTYCGDDGECFSSNDYTNCADALTIYDTLLHMFNASDLAEDPINVKKIKLHIENKCHGLKNRLKNYDYHYERKKTLQQCLHVAQQCFHVNQNLLRFLDGKIKNMLFLHRQKQIEQKRGLKICEELMDILTKHIGRAYCLPFMIHVDSCRFFDIVCGEKVVKTLFNKSETRPSLPLPIIAHIVEYVGVNRYLLTNKQLSKDDGHLIECRVCYQNAIKKRLRCEETQLLTVTHDSIERKKKHNKMKAFYDYGLHIPYEPSDEQLRCLKQCYSPIYSPRCSPTWDGEPL